MARRVIELHEAQVGTVSAEHAAKLGLPPRECEAVWGLDEDGQRLTFVGSTTVIDMMRSALEDGSGLIPVHLISFPAQRTGWPGDDGAAPGLDT